MPTVLDEFIIALSLDPKQFDSAQQESMEKLRGFESRASQTSSRIEQAMRSGMAGFYQEFNKGLNTSGDKLDHVGNRSRRTGEKIYAAGDSGSVGFKHLTTSLLEAYAVVGTLEGAFHKLEQSASRATATTVLAMNIGTTPRELSAVAGMFPLVPHEQAEQSLAKLQQFWQLWQAGSPPTGQMTELARYAGLAHVGMGGPPKEYHEFLLKIREIYRSLAPAMRLQFLQSQGMPMGTGPEFLKSDAQFKRDYEASKARTPLNSVYQAETELTEQTKKTEQAWNTLWETVEATVSKDGGKKMLKDLEHGLVDVNAWIGTTERGAETLNTTLGVLATIFGVTLVTAIGKMLVAINSIWASPLIKFMVANPAVAGAIAFLTAMKPTPAGNAAEVDAETKLGRESYWMARHPGQQLPAGFDWKTYRPGAGGGAAPAGPPGAGIGTPGTAPAGGGAAPAGPPGAGGGVTGPAPGGSSDSINQGIRFFMDKGLTREQATGLTARLAAESGHGVSLDPNAVNPTSGAYGIGQWLGNRKPAALATKGNLGSQLGLVWNELNTTEKGALEQIRAAKTPREAAVAAEAYERAGNPLFTAYAGRLAERIYKGGTSGSNLASGGAPPALSSTSPGPNLVPGGALLAPSASMFTKSAGSSSVSNSSLNVGNITIHTQATDAAGISRDIHHAIHRELNSRATARVMQSNTIYE